MKLCNYYVTLRCNDQCEFDPIWANEGYREIGESGDQGEIFSSLKNLGVETINIIGGEPSMREDLPAIITEAKARGFKINLTTNGILYREMEKAIDGKVDLLYFSLDYPMAEEHDRSRGVECFSEVIDAIKRSTVDSGRRTVIKFVMTRDSVLYLPEMVELADRLGVKVELFPVADHFGAHGFEPATIDHIKYYFRHPRVILNLALWDFVRSGGNKAFLPRCKARETTVTILPDGKRVIPCFYNQTGPQGTADICSGCLRWDYMLPSLASGVDKYTLLNWWSEIMLRRKTS